MVEHWIPSATAYALVGDSFALCRRLNAGLVKARAGLFVASDSTGKREQRDATVPAEFWWAKGFEALDQNWKKGDFSTWIDHKIHLEAFDVSFALSGILEMLPFERRALVARELSVASSKDWLPAARVHDQAIASGVEPASATLAIIREATFGFLPARAVSAEGHTGGAESATWHEREWDLPVWFWAWLPDNGSMSWPEGYVRAQGRAERGFSKVSATGVHFLKDAVDAVFPRAPVVETRPDKSAGGRPPAEFTDDLWAAIAASLYAGDLEPTRQAIVERAMLDWANAHNHQLSESSAKGKARRLFAALKEKDKNP